MSEDTLLLREIRDLLKVMAEPQVAERDRKARLRLLEIVGKGAKNRAAAVAMDGKSTQAELAQSTTIDRAQLSRLVKKLRESSLLREDDDRPQLAIGIPLNFFEEAE